MFINTLPADIRSAFNRAAVSYDQHNTLQCTVANRLIDLLLTQRNIANVVVDVGCGTGYGTQRLMEQLTYHQMIAIDIADKLLEQARKKIIEDDKTHICFGSFNDALFQPQSIDIIFANLSLQWSRDLNWTLKRLYSQLAPGGILAFTIPIAGTFCEVAAPFKNSFTTRETLCHKLVKEAFTLLTVDEKRYVFHFTSPLEALLSIKHVGANRLLHPHWKQQGLTGKGWLKQLFHEGGAANHYPLTYQIAFFIVQR